MNTGTGAGSQAGENKKGKGRRAPIRCVLTLALQAFGLCHVIQFLLHPRSVLRSFAALPQHPGPRWFASPDCLRISADSPVGKKSRTEGGQRYFRQRRKLQPAGGRVQGTPQARAWASACLSVRRFPPRSTSPKQSVFAHFRRSLAGVATVAQALEVAGIREHSPVALVVPDVVHVRGPRPDAVPSTLAAPRLPQELLTAQRLPVLCLVHPAPGGAGLAPLLALRLVLCAVPAGHQPIAARV